MTHDEFIAEYNKISDRAVMLSEKTRREGLLALEELIDLEKANQRDILEYGLRFSIDGTDAAVIRDILSNIIKQEEDKYKRLIMEIKLEAVLSIQAGENPRIIAFKLNSYTDLTLTDDQIISKFDDIMKDEKGALSENEIDAILSGNNCINASVTEENQNKNSLKPELIDFNILGVMEDGSIQRILREVDSIMLAKALKAANRDTYKAVLRNMSRRAAKMVIDNMTYLGPVRLTDVEEAQNNIVKIIRHLEDTGEIVIARRNS